MMKLSLGRMPLKVKFAAFLAMALLLPDVTSMSIGTASPFPSVANGPEADVLEKESALDDFEDNDFESNDYGTVSPDKVTEALSNTGKEITNEDKVTNLEESPKENNPAEVNTAEEENVTDLDETEADALNFIRLVAKRAAEEEEEEKDVQPESVDEDNFSFSDLAKILSPLVNAFSDIPKSEPPPSEDFLSWFPDLKKLVDDPSAAKPAGSVASARRSDFPTSPEPSLQIAPASSQPTPFGDLSSPSLLGESATTVPPTIPEPPQTSQSSLSDSSESEESFY
ncbi:uncharacterized protein LOC133380935 [Rhineura floridana]|uniref:uncharacterized protein LOC133380935 n=1 Tax=Rhineura floridana TaxID=261503 RepID=UPI002AC82398|nr:uncharacterized protein LOC133380935 [Rhineura floridana]